MKVAILGSRGYPYVYSGYETLVKYLAEGLQKENIEVVVYCHKSLFKERPRNVNGIELKYIPTIETKSLSQLIHSFLSMIHVCFSNADVVFVVNAANGPFGLISKVFRKPTAINVDGLEWLRPKWKGLGAKYFKLSAKLATKLYDVIINDSDQMREVYLEDFNTDSVVIAYGGTAKVVEDISLIKKYQLTKEGYYLIVGRLIPDNNADVIIEGFINSRSDKKLVVVGDVPYQDEYAKKVKSIKDDRLIFTGYIKNEKLLRALFQNSYGYLHGHEFGGTNPTMIEALCQNSAIIALNTRFNQEMLSRGEYGQFFEKNAESVREQINECDLKKSLMDEFRNKSHLAITDKYSWPNIIKQYQKVFESLMDGSKVMSNN